MIPNLIKGQSLSKGTSFINPLFKILPLLFGLSANAKGELCSQSQLFMIDNHVPEQCKKYPLC
jgi:hypothetical protein